MTEAKIFGEKEGEEYQPIVNYDGGEIMLVQGQLHYTGSIEQWSALVNFMRNMSEHVAYCDDPNWEDGKTKFFYAAPVQGQIKTFTVSKGYSSGNRSIFYWSMYITYNKKKYRKYVCKFGELTREALKSAREVIEGRILLDKNGVRQG